MSGSRIKWTAEERFAVVSTIAGLLKRQDKPPQALKEPGWFSYYLSFGQAVLPVERRRTSMSLKNSPWVASDLAEFMGEVAPPPPPSVQPDPPIAEETSTDVAMFVKANLDAVIAVLQETHIVAPRVPVKAIHRERSIKVKLPRVFIVGLLPAQAHIVYGQYKGSLDLTFEFSGQSDAFTMPQADHCIALVSFLGHKVDQRLKSAFKGRYQATHGGVSSVMKICSELTKLVK